MEIITMILSGLALLAASVCLFLLGQEKKRSKKQNAALLREMDRRDKKWAATVSDELKAQLAKERNRISLEQKAVGERTGDILKRVENLENGIVPDFEEAKSAAKAVDEFNRGLSSILNFDPLKAAQKSREVE